MGASSSSMFIPLTLSIPLVFTALLFCCLAFALYYTIPTHNYINTYLRSVKDLKISLTLLPVLALALKWSTPSFRANSSASASLIYRLFSRSVLLPTIMIGSVSSHTLRSSFTQFIILLNESTSVMSYTMRAPYAFL